MPADRRQFIAATAAAGLLTVLGQSPARAGHAIMKKKVLFDTDIGSDIDDAVALAYLLAQPQCDLLGITTVTGESVKRAELASALCRVAGRPEVPIYPGAEQPLSGQQRQPEAPQHAALGDRPCQTNFPRSEAVGFMRRTIRAHPGQITLLAVGPLTNLGLLFRADPELPSLLNELVLMCGKFGAEPQRGSHTEWNAKLDADATAIVFGAAPPRLRSYGLDVTLKVTMPHEEVARRFATDTRLQLVLEFAQVWFEKRREVTFHDPLAAVSVFEPNVCGIERGRVDINLQDGPERGRTLFKPDPSGRHEVAFTVDPARFFTAYFSVF